MSLLDQSLKDQNSLIQDQMFKQNPNLANLSFKARKGSLPQNTLRTKKLALNTNLQINGNLNSAPVSPINESKQNLEYLNES
jgi:hypothetical protein